jgi:hypothetical protein
LGLSSEQPMHFCVGKAELFPLVKMCLCQVSRLSR